MNQVYSSLTNKVVRWNAFSFVSVVGLLLVLGTVQPSRALAVCTVTADNTAATDASQSTIFTPEISIPALFAGPQNITSVTIGEYIRAVFVYFIWIVGALAVVMIVWGGVRWIGAAGNPGQITSAREIITNAVIGLVIALTSVVLLNTINPNLTNFNGLIVKRVDPCVLNYVDSIAKDAGPLVEESACDAADGKVAGDPTKVCSKYGCLDTFNTMINEASKHYHVDAVAVKAMIMRESPKDANGNPFSGPSKLPDGTSSGKISSSYGLGQPLSNILHETFAQAEIAIPAACAGDNLRKPTGQLIDSCADWLDKNLPVQVNFVAAIIQQITSNAQVSKSPTIISIIYNLGAGGYKNYLAGDEITGGRNRAAVVASAQSFNTYYHKICLASNMSNTENTSHGPLISQ